MPTTPYELAACPVCASGEGEEIASEDEVRAEVEALWAFHLRRLRRGTPPEHLADRVAFSQRPPLRVDRCAECGTLYRNPRERARELVELYADEETEEEVLRALFETQRAAYDAQARRLCRMAGRAGTGVEVGSYVGAFLAAARDAGWDFEGVDVNARATAFACRMGFRARVAELESLAPERRYDAVAIWNCFDQLPRARATVQAAHRLLSPGGVLAIRVPSGAFYAALRPRLRGPAAPVARALLAHNNLLGFPYRHGYTPASLSRLLREEGFIVRAVHGDALVPIADRWTRRWAAAEERIVKSLLRRLAPASASAWFEIYARRNG